MLTINRQVIEQPHKRTKWGKEYTVEPKFVEESLGNGDRLLILTPLNTRPEYYVIRVDSGWALDNAAEGEMVCDHIDAIYDAIADEYGQKIDTEDEEEQRQNTGWPQLSSDSGSAWGELDWDEYLGMAASFARGVEATG